LAEAQSPGEVKRPPVRRWLIAGIVVVLLAAMAVQVSRGGGDLAQLRRFSPSILILTLVLQFLSQLAFNEAMLLPLRKYVKDLGYWEFFMVRSGGLFVGSVVPVAGNIAVRLMYLRRRGLTYLEFTWATVLSNVLALVAAAALAVFATGWLWVVAGPPPAPVVWLSAGVLAVSIAALVAFQYLPQVAAHPRLRRWRWMADISAFKAGPRTVLWLFALSMIRHGLNFATFGLLYGSLSEAPGAFLTGGLVYALTSPIRMVNVTPGNLGVNEWVVAIAGKALAFDVAIGLIVALLFRGVALVGQGLGVLAGWAWLARHEDGAPA
jgi:uncharacterized membrane protein YbhN (UPF0104 family)